MDIKLKDDSNCFVCGKGNAYGLQLDWKTMGRKTQSDFFPSRFHQGWQGIVHGGILAAMLDEAMTRLAWVVHGGAVTGEMTVRYHSPARIGERLTIKGEIGDKKSRLIPAWAEIRTAGGRLIAEAKGKAVLPRWQQA